MQIQGDKALQKQRKKARAFVRPLCVSATAPFAGCALAFFL